MRSGSKPRRSAATYPATTWLSALQDNGNRLEANRRTSRLLTEMPWCIYDSSDRRSFLFFILLPLGATPATELISFILSFTRFSVLCDPRASRQHFLSLDGVHKNVLLHRLAVPYIQHPVHDGEYIHFAGSWPVSSAQQIGDGTGSSLALP